MSEDRSRKPSGTATQLERAREYIRFVHDQLGRPLAHRTCEWCGPLDRGYIHKNECPIVEVLNHPVAVYGLDK